MNTALWIFAAILGVAAFTWIVCHLLGKIAAPASFGFFVIVPLEGEIENIEEIVADLLWQLGWRQSKECQKIFLADFGMADSTKKLCEKLCNDCEGLFVVSPEELGEALKPHKAGS